MKKIKRILSSLFCLVLFLGLLTGCVSSPSDNSSNKSSQQVESTDQSNESGSSDKSKSKDDSKSDKDTSDSADIKEDKAYTSKSDLKEYIVKYNKLPSNFVTKKEAKAQGWDSSKNYLSDVLPGKSIGGDKFGNFEKKLPNKKNRTYTEADVDYKGGKRNAKRIVFSNDGLIYYTDDHYNTFEKLYGGE